MLLLETSSKHRLVSFLRDNIMNNRDHWESAYSARRYQEQSWFQETPSRSLAMIKSAQLSANSPVIDVGCGASNLVDCLLDHQFKDISLLDVSSVALAQVRKRLGPDAINVHWYQQDILSFVPPRQYALWHDRAVFHFLTQEQDQQRYVDILHQALQPGGHLIIAAFALNGPEKCSGLEVMRHDAITLTGVLGKRFHLRDQDLEDHQTPAGRHQNFGYYRFTFE
jgi:SAM-dependent methyltransferase